MTSPRKIGRSLGLLFLLVIVCGVFAQGFVSERLINFGDAAATANNILAHKGLLQIGFAVYLIEMASQVATAALWYVLLRPVSRPLALTAAFIELAGAIVKTSARVFFIAPLWVLGGGPTVLHSFTTEQVQSIALILLRANDVGAATAMAFFGFSTFLNGYLIFKSTFMPRWLGVLGMIAGLCWLLYLYPPLGRGAFGITAPYGLLVSVAMILWLTIRGVDEAKWKQLAADE
ncbi:MAG TPA: DUF4386 domain-containing protein [Pyrinomonadaceae bacterium]|jgi:hypothetical protein|nr:DUF4386 domain-containing protein [Pyrinomonadaceae bacterium]